MTKAAELAKMGEVLTNNQIGGRRNLILNPKMEIAQRGTSTTGVTSGGYYVIDRFRLTTTAEQTETHAQVSDAPSGFKSSYKVTVTTADSSIDASDFAGIQQKIEAQDLQHLKYGTSYAEKLTVSFYVKASATGTFAVGMTQDDASSGTSEISQNYTISSADTWEYKTLTFNGNTTDAIDNNNGSGLQLTFFYTAGSDLTSGTLNTWGDNAHRAIGHTANLVGTLNATFQITGVQMEVGEQATPFEHRSFGEEEKLCHRYYQRIIRQTGFGFCGVGVGPYNSTTAIFIEAVLSERMRTQPTVGYSQLSDFDLEPFDVAPTAIVLHGNGGGSASNVIRLEVTDPSARTKGFCGELMIDIETGYIEFDAEL